MGMPESASTKLPYTDHYPKIERPKTLKRKGNWKSVLVISYPLLNSGKALEYENKLSSNNNNISYKIYYISF